MFPRSRAGRARHAGVRRPGVSGGCRCLNPRLNHARSRASDFCSKREGLWLPPSQRDAPNGLGGVAVLLHPSRGFYGVSPQHFAGIGVVPSRTLPGTERFSRACAALAVTAEIVLGVAPENRLQRDRKQVDYGRRGTVRMNSKLNCRHCRVPMRAYPCKQRSRAP